EPVSGPQKAEGSRLPSAFAGLLVIAASRLRQRRNHRAVREPPSHCAGAAGRRFPDLQDQERLAAEALVAGADQAAQVREKLRLVRRAWCGNQLTCLLFLAHATPLYHSLHVRLKVMSDESKPTGCNPWACSHR